MYQTIIQQTKPEMEKAAEFLGRELAKIRTGQASPSLVEDVEVEAYGTKMQLKQLAGITCPERNQILIQPWERTYLEPIEKALRQSSLGTSPVVDKESIRITLPPLTQEFRDRLVRLMAEKGEEAKRTIRHAREEAWSEIQQQERAGAIREDDKFRGRDELQKLVEEYTKKIDELLERKRKEIEL